MENVVLLHESGRDHRLVQQFGPLDLSPWFNDYVLSVMVKVRLCKSLRILFTYVKLKRLINFLAKGGMFFLLNFFFKLK